MHKTVSLKILKVWKIRIQTLVHQQPKCYGITTEWYQVLQWHQLHDTWIAFQHFRKKKLKAAKRNKPPTRKHHSYRPKQTKKNIFSILSIGNWSTFLRMIRTHWLLFNMQTSLIPPSGWYQNVRLLSGAVFHLDSGMLRCFRAPGKAKACHADLPQEMGWAPLLPRAPQLQSAQLEPLHCSAHAGSTHFVQQ